MLKLRQSIDNKCKIWEEEITNAPESTVLDILTAYNRWRARNDLYWLCCQTGHKEIAKLRKYYEPFCDEVSLVNWKISHSKLLDPHEDMLSLPDVSDDLEKDLKYFERLYLAFRGFYKSTIITQVGSLQLILNYPNIKLAIIHNKQENASDNLIAIKNMFLTTQIKEWFPEFIPKGKEWGNLSGFSVACRTDWEKIEDTIEAVGVGSEIIGRHWHVAKKNDLVTEDSVSTKEQIEKTYKWNERFNLGHFVDLTKPFQDYEGTHYAYCLHPNQKIIVDGKRKNIVDIAVGDKVINSKGKQTEVVALSHRKANELIEIELYNTNEKVVVTPEHKMFVGDKFIPANELNDYIAYPINNNFLSEKEILSYFPSLKSDYKHKLRRNIFSRKKPKISKERLISLLDTSTMKSISKNENISKSEIARYSWFYGINSKNKYKNILNNKYFTSEDMWRLIGYWLAEGCICGRKDNGAIINFSFRTNEPIQKDCICIIYKLFGVLPSVYTVNNCTRINISSLQLKDFLSNNFLKGAKSKKIPYWVESLPLSLQRELILGYWLGDGCVTKVGYRLSSISLDLLQGVQRILLRFGIVSSIYNASNGKQETYICNAKCKTNDSYELRFRHIDGDSLFNNKSKFKKRIRKTHGFIKDGMFFAKIKSKKYIEYNGLVYDISVKDGHSFCGQLICYHNSDLYSTLKSDNNIKYTKIPVMSDYEDNTSAYIPERFPSDALGNLKQKDPWTFFCQMMLEPKDPSKMGFTPQMISYYPYLPYNLYYYLFIDPASARKKKSDYTVMLVVGVDSNRTKHIADGIRDKLDPKQRISEAIRLCLRWNIKSIGWEAIAFQATDCVNFEEERRLNRINVALHEIKSHTASKIDRIYGLLPEYFNSQWLWPQKGSIIRNRMYDGKSYDLTEEMEYELLKFPLAEHDDIIDTQTFFKEMPEIIYPLESDYVSKETSNTLTMGEISKIKDDRINGATKNPWSSFSATRF